MATVQAIAAELTTKLAANVWSIPLDITRAWVPEFDKARQAFTSSAANPKLTVIGGGIEAALSDSTGSYDHTLLVNVVIQRRVTTVAEGDTMADLAEEIGEFIQSETYGFAAAGGTAIGEMDIMLMFDADALRDERVWTSVIGIKFWTSHD